jgi:hypothetical protein
MSAVSTYRSHRGLPHLAGLATMAEAVRPGLGVEACVARLKRFHYAFKRLHEILIARITAEPIYELKTIYSHHGYLCAEHVAALRRRVGEMREPPLGLEEVPHPGLKLAFDEILTAPTTEGLLLGIYAVVLPKVISAVERYQTDTHPLADAPTRRVLRFALIELGDMLAVGRAALDAIVSTDEHLATESWRDLLVKALAWAGGVDGVDEPAPADLSPMYSAKPYDYDPVPRRDERFQDLYNQGVNAEAFLYDPTYPPEPKTLMMMFKRLREIDVPEMMASIIVQTPGKPWEYYLDMTRQLWDEARHAMMGEVGFVAAGVDWTQARITHNWSLRLNTECTPLERHAVLYYIEQGLMTKTGKRFEWEVGHASGNPLMATFQDFDWADEVLHSQIGRQWYIPQVGDWKQALAYGDACWSRIVSNWHTVKEQGLTDHANWWPSIYRQACAAWRIEPDPRVMAYNISYAGQRADLKEVELSGASA